MYLYSLVCQRIEKQNIVIYHTRCSTQTHVVQSRSLKPSFVKIKGKEMLPPFCHINKWEQRKIEKGSFILNKIKRQQSCNFVFEQSYKLTFVKQHIFDLYARTDNFICSFLVERSSVLCILLYCIYIVKIQTYCILHM